MISTQSQRRSGIKGRNMSNLDQIGLFQGSTKQDKNQSDNSSPLAYRVRPTRLDQYQGQSEVFKRYPRLKDGQFGSLILWGPPGVGKTTLA